MLKKYSVILLLFTLVTLTCKVQMDPQLEEHLETISSTSDSQSVEQQIDPGDNRLYLSLYSENTVVYNNSYVFPVRKIGQEKIASFYIQNHSNRATYLSVNISNIDDFETNFMNTVIPQGGIYSFYVKFIPASVGFRYMEITVTDDETNEVFTMFFEGEATL